jgi:membrane protease YdiL (CAAX protease family)
VSDRLIAWLVLVGAQIILNYSIRASSGKPDRNYVYEYGTSVSAIVFYGVIFSIIVALAREDIGGQLALRSPKSWSRALSGALVVIIAVVAVEYALSPLHADEEQGLTPTHWEPSHAGAFAASFVALALVGPFVEEATFRGLGYTLLAVYGRITAIAVTALLFGLAHGLVEALPILVALGAGLAWLRARTDSLYPCFLVHAIFNALALIVAVST